MKLAEKIFESGKDKFEDMECYIEKTKTIEMSVFNGELDKYNISDTEGMSFRGINNEKNGIFLYRKGRRILHRYASK